ncbi:hypothetical protein GQ44DRAFT_711482 [Phaeosphaeriaceae sp. PMI808]|nr:hypothetical protein GQ44DRAFT_711482 [Phaeosphaeriaceae sp. PMI808]
MLRPYAGVNNLVVQEGSVWKKWRTLFNPAFSAVMLREHTLDLVYECKKFCNYLKTCSRSGASKIYSGSSFARSPGGR